MSEGFWQTYHLDFLPSIAPGSVANQNITFDIAGVVQRQARNFFGGSHLLSRPSGVLSAGSVRKTIRINYSQGFAVDLDVFPPKLPDTAIHEVELESETLKRLEELLKARKTDTYILGGSILHSFDIISGPSTRLKQQAANIFASGGEEVLEDGMESSFARSLLAFLNAQGQNALQAVEDLIRSTETNADVAFEATRLLGTLVHPRSHIPRRKFLEELLDSTSVRLRHAAASGLAAMADPAAFSAVDSAKKNERNQRLRNYLALVADQLEHHR